jgi:ABC-type branched-subunit amino acid transport system substrate-binding protein
MSGKDMADLVAYMKVLEHDLDPGVENDAVRVATLLPLTGRAAGTGEAMRRVLEGHFNDINEMGGVFGRRIELLTVPMAETAEGTVATLREAFETDDIFALVGAYTIGLDEQLLEFLRSDNEPLVGPFTLDPGDAFIDEAAFYLYSGFDQQARVLVDLALLQRAGAGQVAIVAPEGPRADRLVRSASDQLRKKGANDKSLTARYEQGALDASALAARVTDAEAMLFLGGHDDLQQTLGALADSGTAPRVYVLSSSLVRPLFDVPAVFDQRIFIAYPTLSSDISPKGRQEYQQLVDTYSLTREHVQAQLAAFAAGKLLVEGLRRAGRDLSRIRLVDGLEELYEFKTGVAPPLTYGPNRRIGALGAHVVAVDLENQRYGPVGDGWYKLR